MEDEIKSLLKKNIEISQENNKLLRKLWNVQRWLQISRVFYWIIIIGIAFGAFYYLKPILGNFINIYNGGVTEVNMIRDSIKNMNVKDLQEIIK